MSSSSSSSDAALRPDTSAFGFVPVFIDGVSNINGKAEALLSWGLAADPDNDTDTSDDEEDEEEEQEGKEEEDIGETVEEQECDVEAVTDAPCCTVRDALEDLKSNTAFRIAVAAAAEENSNWEEEDTEGSAAAPEAALTTAGGAGLDFCCRVLLIVGSRAATDAGCATIPSLC